MQVHDKKIIICDLDGTIANVQHRLHYIKNADGTKKKHKDTDWNSFHKACVDDEPYKDVIEILQSLVLGMGNGCNVCGAVEREFYFFSGRNEAVRSETIEWLKRHVPITEDWHWELYMRSEGDRRPDTTVKYEMMYELKIMPEDVLCILDDRQSVVDMWRANGFRVMQVDAWKEEERWQDKLRVQITETSEKHDHSGGRSKYKKAQYMAYRKATEVDNFFGTFEEFIANHPPYLSVPEYDLGDVNAATDAFIKHELEKKEDEK